MLDKLQRIAQAIEILRLPSVIVGLISFTSVVVIILTSKSHQEDRFLIPSIVILFWVVNTHTFITTFRSVPEKTLQTLGFWDKLRSRIFRGWYWFTAVIFFVATVAVTIVTFRLMSFWLSDDWG